MVARLQRRDRLVAAAAHGVGRCLVALDLYGPAVRHGHPHTALHLPASATATANAFDFAHTICGSVRSFGQSAFRIQNKIRRNCRDRRRFQEAPSGQVQ